MKKFLRIGAAILLFLPTLAMHHSVHAQNSLTSTYHYAGFSKALVYMEELDIDFVGLEFEASYLHNEKWFIDASHYDLSGDYLLSSERRNERTQIRLGHRFPSKITASTDFYVTVGMLESEITSNFDLPLGDDATTASVGIKNRAWRFIEIDAQYHYAQWQESESGGYVSVGMMLMLFPHFSLKGSIVNQQDAVTYRLGGLFHF